MNIDELTSDSSVVETKRYKPRLRFETLSYSNAGFEVEDGLKRQIRDFDRNHAQMLKFWENTLQDVKINQRNVRLAYVWATASIKTDTDQVDSQTPNLDLGNYASVKKFLESTRDGKKKWEKAWEFWNSDMPQKVASRMLKGDVIGAQAVLCGLHEDSGRSWHYARPTKANFITTLLGDPDSLCLDTRRHGVLQDTLKNALPGYVKGVDDDHGRFRQKGVPTNAHRNPAWSVRFLQTKMERNPGELRVITRRILDRLEEETGVNRMRIKHILFLLGGDVTFHQELLEKMEK